MTISADRQVELEGLLMGPGTSYAWEQFNPWDYPDLAANDMGLAQRHGVMSGSDLLRARRIGGILHVVTASKQATIDAFHTLVAAWQPQQTDVPLTFRAGSRTYRVNGRPRRAAGDPRLIHGGAMRVECRFIATDPFLYDNTEQHAASAFPEPSDWYTDEYPDVYLDGLLDGRMPFNNIGTVDAPWIMEITGPWTNPRVQLLSLDEPFVGWQFPIDVDLADGEVLRIESNRQLLWVDGVPRLDLLTIDQHWFGIPPGAWALRVDGDAGSGTVESWVRSTWL